MKDKDFLARGCCSSPKPFLKNDKVFKHGCNKLDVFDWLNDIDLPENIKAFDCIEVRFKNCRKDFYRLPGEMELEVGDIVAVEANPGHDIGIVTLTGETVRFQMRKKGIDYTKDDIKKVYRKAKSSDIEKWNSAIELENSTMFRARRIAAELNLDMKISDVEYQGDKIKATFFYTAEERVDFRELIKLFADEFGIRIEMKQIGVRQEASRLGGIGSCGRELCCSTWLTDFRSVSTNAARCQQLSLNTQKLAGQCSKLKCCINYEYDNYLDSLKDFPDFDAVLKTKRGNAYHQKTDIFKNIMWYAYENNINAMFPVSVEIVKKTIELNSRNIIPEELEQIKIVKADDKDFEVGVGEDSLTRFDK
jgi:cell fate regulator YaaT (PSP1 superfamily)